MRCPCLTAEEWCLVKAEIPRAKRGGNKRTVNVRCLVGPLAASVRKFTVRA